MIIKGCVQWNSVYGREDFSSSEDQTRSARSVGQCLPHQATGASGVSRYLKEKLFIVQLIVFKCLQLSLNAPWYTSMFFFFFFFLFCFAVFIIFIFFQRETNRIHHRSPMQTEKSQSEDKHILPETRFAEFPALSVDPRAGISRSALKTDD